MDSPVRRVYGFTAAGLNGLAAAVHQPDGLVLDRLNLWCDVEVAANSETDAVVVCKARTGDGVRPVAAEDAGRLLAAFLADKPPAAAGRPAVLLAFLSSGRDSFTLWSKVAVSGDGRANEIMSRSVTCATRAEAASHLCTVVTAARVKFPDTKVKVFDAAAYAAGPGCPFTSAAVALASVRRGFTPEERDLLDQAMRAISTDVMAFVR